MTQKFIGKFSWLDEKFNTRAYLINFVLCIFQLRMLIVKFKLIEIVLFYFSLRHQRTTGRRNTIINAT